MELNKNLLALVYFFEENRYSVLKLKDAVKPADLHLLDINDWDPKKTVETRWCNESYPANFLQFGENKNAMESLIDDLANGTIRAEEVPIFQNVKMSKQRCRPYSQPQQELAAELQQSKRQKLAVVKDAKIRREKKILTSVQDVKESCELTAECSGCKKSNTEVALLKKQVIELAAEVQTKNEAIERFQIKYKRMKEKYRASKQKKEQEVNDSNLVTIGDSLHVEKHRLALCRVSDFSKYTCDLLDVVFGREKLANSVVKGIKGSNKPTLDPNYVSDIQGHVASKFGVNVSLVRATIRNKLNSASKAMKN